MPVRKKAPEDLTAKKALALEVIRRLKAEYPDAGCTLDYDHAWQLLVSVRLAAQCTDARVNIVVEELFAKYPSVAALAAAEPEDIEAIVKPCGLGHSKARDISACMRMLRDKYDCKVPTTFEELLSLPGGKPFESKEAWKRESEERYRKKHNLPPLEKPVKTASATTSKPPAKGRPKTGSSGKRRRKTFKKQVPKLLKGIGTNKKAINDSTAEAAKAKLLSSRKVAADSAKLKERVKKMKQREAFKE